MVHIDNSTNKSKYMSSYKVLVYANIRGSLSAHDGDQWQIDHVQYVTCCEDNVDYLIKKVSWSVMVVVCVEAVHVKKTTVFTIFLMPLPIMITLARSRFENVVMPVTQLYTQSFIKIRSWVSGVAQW